MGAFIPWSTISNDAEGFTDVNEALENYGLNYQVETTPLTDMVPTPDGQAFTRRSFGNWHGIRRTDTLEPFGVCGNSWQPLQNADAWGFFQEWMDAGLVKLEQVGILGGGRKQFILAELNSPPLEVIPGDQIQKYIMLANGHDGKTAIRGGFMPYRLSCTNQFPLIAAGLLGRMISIRHSRLAPVHLSRIKELMDVANATFETTAEQLQTLRKGLNSKDVERFVKTVIAGEKDAEKPLEDFAGRTRNKISRIVELTETGRGLQAEGIRGTWYAAFNAVNEFLNHEAGRSESTRVDSLWFGQNGAMNRRALDTAVAMATAT